MNEPKLIPRPHCETCGGSGCIPDTSIEPECCGRFDKYGGCCNNPIPVQVITGVHPCPECEEVNDIENEQIEKL